MKRESDATVLDPAWTPPSNIQYPIYGTSPETQGEAAYTSTAWKWEVMKSRSKDQCETCMHFATSLIKLALIMFCIRNEGSHLSPHLPTYYNYCLHNHAYREEGWSKPWWQSRWKLRHDMADPVLYLLPGQRLCLVARFPSAQAELDRQENNQMKSKPGRPKLHRCIIEKSEEMAQFLPTPDHEGFAQKCTPNNIPVSSFITVF